MNDRISNFARSIGAAYILFAAPLVHAGEPVLRLESQTPLSLVTSAKFGDDGRLFTAGFDKVVRSWKFEGAKGWRVANTYRVPVGPGIVGALNDAAISDDDRWLATGGNGWFRHSADFRTTGVVYGRDVLDLESRKEIGAIQLFDRQTNASTPLVNHAGPIVALSFDGNTLASLAWEFTDKMEVGEYSVDVWDAPSKKLIAQTRLSGVPGPTKIRPGFVVRRLSGAEKDVAVVMAFGEGNVPIWRPKRAAEFVPLKVGALATSVCEAVGASVYLATSTKDQNRWTPTIFQLFLAGDSPRAEETLKVPVTGNAIAVGVGASRDVRAPAIGVVFRTLDGEKEDFLFVQKAGAGAPQVSRRSLGKIIVNNPPRMAISHDGKYAAVTDPYVGRFRILPLFNEQDPGAEFPPSKPNDLYFPPDRIEFAESNGELGIAFPKRKAAIGEGVQPAIFDPKNGSVHLLGQRPQDGWKLIAPELPPGVSIEPSPDAKSLRCTTPVGERVIAIQDSVITAYLGIQPNKNGPMLAAVALIDKLGQPELRIYRADTGDQVRRCSAHTARITGLSASADGGLLLSTSQDHTFGFWSLGDLDDVVGAISGLNLDVNRRVVSLSPAVAASGLQTGDLIVGILQDGKFQPFASPVEIHAAARTIKPGRTMDVVFERNGGRFQAAIPVEQGVDERKPLAILHCKNAEQWIAWSPFGPYDSNFDAAEEWIGWHFNPEDKAPLRFALGSQYRQQYRRPGILRRLLQTRSLTAALDMWRRLDAEPPDPNIGLSMSPVDLSRGDAWIAPKKDVELTLRITNDEFPLERLESLKAIIDGEPASLVKIRPNEYKAKVSFRKPGRHVVRMAAETSAPLPRHFEDERVVLYSPAKPTLSPNESWIAQSKAKAQADGVWVAPSQEGGEFKLQSKLTADPAFGAMAPSVSINGVPQTRATDLNDLRLPLRIGENRIVVSAAPKSPTEDVDSSAQFVVVVRRTEPPETFAPPTIIVERAEVGAERTPRKFDAAGSAVVDRTLVRIVGRTTSKENVARFDVDGKPADGFLAAKDAPFVIEKQLTPGVNRIRFAAKGTSGVESRQELTLECKPPLPKAAVVLDESNREWRWTGEGLTAKTTVRFEGVSERLPIAAVLKRNGTVVARVERTADDPSNWSVSTPLQPGENRFTVDLESSWAKGSGAATTVMVRRPPKLVGVKSTAVGLKPFVDLTLDVEALDGWAASELIVNDRAHQVVERMQQGPADAAGVIRWKLVAKNVALRQGPNDFSVVVRNAEGESPPKKVEGLVYAPPPPPRAKITWLSPSVDATRDQPELEASFRIESTTPLLSTSFGVGSGKVTTLAPVKVADGPEGAVVYEVRRTVTLQPGRNAFSVRVLNEGGETNSDRLVSFTPKPATVNITALESGQDVVKPQRGKDGSARFGVVKAGKQTLVGEVVFSDAKSPDLSANASVRILVKGLQQQTAELGPAEGNVRRFRARIALNSKDVNDLFVEVVGLSIDADCNIRGTVAGCQNPIDRKWLHLVLIGVGDKDEAKFRAEAMDAFRDFVEVKQGSEGGKPAYERIIPKQVVGGYVTAPTIREAIDKLRMELVENAGRQDGSHVVGFYFRGQYFCGQESGDRQRIKLLTSEPEWMPRSKFDAGDLNTRFADVPGAQMLLLDASRNEKSAELVNYDSPFKRPNACLLGFVRQSKEAPMLFAAVKAAMPKVGKLGELKQVLTSLPLPEGSKFKENVPEPLEGLELSRREFAVSAAK